MTNPWRDPRVPASQVCVLRPLLEQRAADTPGKVFARCADGSTWTYVKRERIGAIVAPGEERRPR